MWLNLLCRLSFMPPLPSSLLLLISLASTALVAECLFQVLAGCEHLNHLKYPTHMEEWGRKRKKRRNQEEGFNSYYYHHHHYCMFLLQKWKRLFIICRCLGKVCSQCSTKDVSITFICPVIMSLHYSEEDVLPTPRGIIPFYFTRELHFRNLRQKVQQEDF